LGEQTKGSLLSCTWRRVTETLLLSPFTGASIDALSIRANWLRKAPPGSAATVAGIDVAGRTLIDVGGVRIGWQSCWASPAIRIERRFGIGGC